VTEHSQPVAVPTDQRSVSSTRHISLRPLRLNRERECYVTVFYDLENKVDVVIGAASPQATFDAFERLTGLKCEAEKISASLFRRQIPGEITVGEGFASFRKRVLRALYG
jgi:hypothetical protein